MYRLSPIDVRTALEITSDLNTCQSHYTSLRKIALAQNVTLKTSEIALDTLETRLQFLDSLNTESISELERHILQMHQQQVKQQRKTWWHKFGLYAMGAIILGETTVILLQ